MNSKANKSSDAKAPADLNSATFKDLKLPASIDKHQRNKLGTD